MTGESMMSNYMENRDNGLKIIACYREDTCPSNRVRSKRNLEKALGKALF
jgi:hypothetical protein